MQDAHAATLAAAQALAAAQQAREQAQALAQARQELMQAQQAAALEKAEPTCARFWAEALIRWQSDKPINQVIGSRAGSAATFSALVLLIGSTSGP